MDFEPWWLIVVPVLFGLGWIAARVDFRQMLSESKRLPDSYFKGLNFLLNEEPDQAIDAFIEVAKLDSETVELHFALGNLFRRRGEIERAIRVHQSLLARADLQPAAREDAQFELAQDFLKAGMLDRAETAFEGVTGTRHGVAAMQALVRIYEAGHDWPKAIEAAKRLSLLTQAPVPQQVHYYCEQAEMELKSRSPDLDKAQEAIDGAQRAAEQLGSACSLGAKVRMAMLQALWAQRSQLPEQQRDELEPILQFAPQYAGLMANALMVAYEQLQQFDAGLELLLKHYDQHPNLDVFNEVFKALRTQRGSIEAWHFARKALRRLPSLLALDRMLEVELSLQQSEEIPAEAKDLVQDSLSKEIAAGADLSLLRSLIHKHTQRLERYACEECGFETRHYYWQCPGCNYWESYPPLRLEELQ